MPGPSAVTRERQTRRVTAERGPSSPCRLAAHGFLSAPTDRLTPWAWNGETFKTSAMPAPSSPDSANASKHRAAGGGCTMSTT